MTRSSVVLPQPDGPRMKENEIAFGDIQTDVRERLDLAVRCLIGQRNAVRPDHERRGDAAGPSSRIASPGPRMSSMTL